MFASPFSFPLFFYVRTPTVDVPVPNTTTAECRNERHRPPFASRRAGDRAHRDIERGKLTLDRICAEVVTLAASRVGGRQQSAGFDRFLEFPPFDIIIKGE